MKKIFKVIKEAFSKAIKVIKEAFSKAIKVIKEAFSKAIKVFWNVLLGPIFLALLIHDLLILSLAEIAIAITRGGN